MKIKASRISGRQYNSLTAMCNSNNTRNVLYVAKGQVLDDY